MSHNKHDVNTGDASIHEDTRYDAWGPAIAGSTITTGHSSSLKQSSTSDKPLMNLPNNSSSSTKHFSAQALTLASEQNLSAQSSEMIASLPTAKTIDDLPTEIICMLGEKVESLFLMRSLNRRLRDGVDFIFHTPRLKSVIIKPLDWPRRISMNDVVLDHTQRWPLTHEHQHHIMSAIFSGIQDSPLQLEELSIPRLGEVPFRHLMVLTPLLLSPIRWGSLCYTNLKTLELGFGLQKVLSLTQLQREMKFLNVLNGVPNLQHLTIFLLGDKLDLERREWVATEISPRILKSLAKDKVGDPPFLRKLHLKGVIARSEITFDKILHAHGQTLRDLCLCEFELEPPNNMENFWKALSELDLECLVWRRLKNTCGRYIRTWPVWTVEQDQLEWGEDADNESKDESFRDWQVLQLSSPFTWVRHLGNVKGSMREVVALLPFVNGGEYLDRRVLITN
ncbi:uncharacterized protein BDR25DRAFT_314744 [Lindgomyces ingoldianus]|uniref:Uncharacterized protein n=1 Tax=Lindgomyces ingoldianus TaxID=673940 RepID=A0ACB6QTS7_9PLEO|nr:uncharacterized protein BDR25DRAFT_314744 [Lindgomyces ingoldianus]KAF2469973.1 hypothetical protein BDR25DRAFT_314744 [Lindgomyces ingoldianus]